MHRRQFLTAGAAATGLTTAGIATAGLATAGIATAGVVAVDSGTAGATPQPPPARGHAVRTGFEVLAESGYAALAGAKVGMIANPTTITRGLEHKVDLMHVSPDVQVAAAFGPEHGFRGTAQAGGSEGLYIDAATGLPVYDTYSARAPGPPRTVRPSGIDIVGVRHPGRRRALLHLHLDAVRCMEAAASDRASRSWCSTGPTR